MSDLIKITTKDGKQLVSARELYEGLNFDFNSGNFTHWVKSKLDFLETVKDVDFTEICYKYKDNNADVKDYIITINVAKEICLLCLSSIRTKKSTKKAANLILNYLVLVTGEGVGVQIKTRKELEFLDKLKTSLIPFNIKGINQYTVLNYRIDYYIPSLNIAIEYDENDHRNYSYKSHKGRQKEIEKELGCRFIRVSDKNSDEYNIGLVIKEIFNIKEGN